MLVLLMFFNIVRALLGGEAKAINAVFMQTSTVLTPPNIGLRFFASKS